MKIAWMSNAPWANTGYGNQTRVFVTRLQQAGHKMAVTATWGLEGSTLAWDGIPVFPKGYRSFGDDVAAANAANFDADILISLLDAWPVEPKMLQSGPAPWVPWYPVDSEPLPPPVMHNVAKAHDRIVFSRFGETMTRQAGLDCYYVPHGIDTNIFQPLDQSEARDELGLPENAFIVGMVAANKGTPSRKAFPQNIEAFARLRRRHTDAVLYLHTTRSEHGEAGGVNLPELCAYFGLEVGKDVIFVDQHNLLLGLPGEYMAKVYSAMDVHLLASMGEGFGIPIVEAQACGTPVIVGDWTSMSEICFAGWKVPKDRATKYWTPLAAFQYIPHVDAIEELLLEAYDKAGKKHLKRDARVGALDYDADTVTERYWLPVLEEIEAGLEDLDERA